MTARRESASGTLDVSRVPRNDHISVSPSISGLSLINPIFPARVMYSPIPAITVSIDGDVSGVTISLAADCHVVT